MRNDPGLAPLSKPPSLEGMSSEERVDAMVEWFFENFEDPAQETPYNGREGGYLYIHGGPYEAQDYIPDAFPDAEEDEHTEAIDRIDGDGPEFAPAGHRILAPEEDFDEEPPREPLSQKLDALAGQLDRIEVHVNALLDARISDTTEQIPGIGHNGPPVEEEADGPDLLAVRESIAAVRQELAKPDREDTADEAVLELAQSRFARFRAWVRERVSEAPTKLVQGGLTAVGGIVVTYIWNHQADLLSLLDTAINTLGHWTSSITGIF